MLCCRSIIVDMEEDESEGIDTLYNTHTTSFPPLLDRATLPGTRHLVENNHESNRVESTQVSSSSLEFDHTCQNYRRIIQLYEYKFSQRWVWCHTGSPITWVPMSLRPDYTKENSIDVFFCCSRSM
mmetsp:Transcript_59434/g.64178  ORF Transcript_59434/g.64178 Transcript_59434/m.64178 type:complete len:126 (-) Transcript_59434:427-804(-)